MDDISTKTGNSSASNATDFQPTTANPQNDVGGLQSTTGLQSGSNGFTQDSLNRSQTLTVQTDRSSTSIAPQTTGLQLTEARTSLIGLVFLALVVAAIIVLRRQFKKPRNPTEAFVAPNEPAGIPLEDSRPVKKKAKPSKARPRKKTKR